MIRAKFYYGESSKLPDCIDYPNHAVGMKRDGERPLRCVIDGDVDGLSQRSLGKWVRAMTNALRQGGELVLEDEVKNFMSETVDKEYECKPSQLWPFSTVSESKLEQLDYIVLEDGTAGPDEELENEKIAANLNVAPSHPYEDTHEALTFGPLSVHVDDVPGLRFRAGPLLDDPLVNPKAAAGAVKAPFHATPELGLIMMENVMAGGGYKYGDFNYHDSKVDAATYLSAIRRHLLLWKDGVDMDAESYQNHLAHVMACCAILIEAQGTGMFIDNRPKTGLIEEALIKSSSTFANYRANHDFKVSNPENDSE